MNENTHGPDTMASQPHISAVSAPPSSQSLLPLQFLEELYRILLSIEPVFLTCDDLDFSFLESPPANPTELQAAYRQEFANWLTSPRPICPHILILHDTDSGPVETLELCRLERSLGIVSTVSTYARCAYPPKGGCEYEIDFDALVEMQKAGFGITYHCNAASQVYRCAYGSVYANYDADVELLRSKGLRIDYYAAHGESQLPKKWQNMNFFYPAHVRYPLISTHSGYSCMWHAFYNDGALLSKR